MSKRRVGFNAVFSEANRTRARYRILMGSAGSGKSMNVASDYILKLSDKRFAGANLLAVRKTDTSNDTSTFPELCGAVYRIFGDRWSDFWEIRQSPPSLRSLITGSQILFRGVKDLSQQEKLKSICFTKGKLTWIWCEEATELSPNDFDILDDRLRGKLPGNALYYQITLTFNPVSAQHWIKKRFFDVPPSEDVFLNHSTYLDNRFIDADYHRRMERRAREDPEGYRIYGLGEWGECGGLILPKIEQRMLDPDLQAYDFVSMGQDFGFNHANCILLVGFRDMRPHVLRELYLREMDTGEIIEAADAAGFPKQVPMYCDSAEPDRIRMWQKAGYAARAVKKEPGSVTAQIDFLKRYPPVVDFGCENLLRELSMWKWMADPVTGMYSDMPTPVDDDAIAALRYATEPIRKGRQGMRTIQKNLLGL